jgi:hypothetical protein
MIPSPLLGGPEEVLKSFRFQINGTSDPDAQVPSGAVQDIVRTSAGLFTITLPQTERYPVLVSCTGSVQQAAVGTTGTAFTVVSYTASTGVLVVRTVDTTAGQAADDPADDDWVHVQAVFCRMTVLAPTGAV